MCLYLSLAVACSEIEHCVLLDVFVMMLYLFLGLKVDQQKPEMSGKARRNQVNCISIQFLLYFQVFFHN